MVNALKMRFAVPGFIVIALILLILSLFMPWFKITTTLSDDSSSVWTDPSSSGPSTYYTEFKFNEVTERTVSGDTEISVTMPYSNDAFTGDKVVPVYSTTNGIVIFAVLMTIILLVTASVIAARRGKGARAGMVIAILTVLFTLGGPLYFMSAEPAAAKEQFDEDYRDIDTSVIEESFSMRVERKMGEQFFGSESNDQEGYINGVSWGGSSGWMLAIFAFIFNIMALVVLVFVRKQARDDEYYDLIPPYDEPEPPGKTAPVLYDAELVVPETVNISCPKCKSAFKVKDTGRPLKIECPYCGISGELG